MALFCLYYSTISTTLYKRRLLNYSPFGDHCAVARQSRMLEIALCRTHLFCGQHRIDSRDAGEVPVPLFNTRYRGYKMHMYHFAHFDNKNSKNILYNHYLEYIL